MSVLYQQCDECRQPIRSEQVFTTKPSPIHTTCYIVRLRNSNQALTDEVASLQDTIHTAGFLLADEKAEVATLREALGEANRLLTAVGASEFGGVNAYDIDGSNWFDARDKAATKFRQLLNSKGPTDNT